MLTNDAKTVVNRSAVIFVYLPFGVAFVLMIPMAYITHSLFLSVSPMIVFGAWMIPGSIIEFLYIFNRVDKFSLHSYLEKSYQQNLDMFLFRQNSVDVNRLWETLKRKKYTLTEDKQGYFKQRRCILRYPDHFWMPIAHTYILQVTFDPINGITEFPEFRNDLPVFHVVVVSDPSSVVDWNIPHLCAVVQPNLSPGITRRIPMVDCSLPKYDNFKRVSFYRKKVSKDLMLIENSISVNIGLNYLFNRF